MCLISVTQLSHSLLVVTYMTGKEVFGGYNKTSSSESTLDADCEILDRNREGDRWRCGH
jgi:hypothetical protein